MISRAFGRYRVRIDREYSNLTASCFGKVLGKEKVQFLNDRILETWKLSNDFRTGSRTLALILDINWVRLMVYGKIYDFAIVKLTRTHIDKW